MGMGTTSQSLGGTQSALGTTGPPRAAYASNTSSAGGLNTSGGFGQNQYGTSQSQFSLIDDTTARGRQQAKVRRLIDQGKRMAEHERQQKAKFERDVKMNKITADGKKVPKQKSSQNPQQSKVDY